MHLQGLHAQETRDKSHLRGVSARQGSRSARLSTARLSNAAPATGAGRAALKPLTQSTVSSSFKTLFGTLCSAVGLAAMVLNREEMT